MKAGSRIPAFGCICCVAHASSRACLRHSLSWQVASSTRKFIQKLFSERSPPKQEGSARALSDHSQQANSLVHRCFWTRKREDCLIFKKVRIFNLIINKIRSGKFPSFFFQEITHYFLESIFLLQAKKGQKMADANGKNEEDVSKMFLKKKYLGQNSHCPKIQLNLNF